MAETGLREAAPPLPRERLRRVEGWGMWQRSMGYVYRPSTVDGVREVLELARATGRSVVPRGSGYSYGDLALNAENIVLDLSRMNRVLSWDPSTGAIEVEPGVTVRQLWRTAIEDGWWPPVVPGAMYPTVGGVAAVNAHGKNAWREGTVGEHIESLDLLLPDGTPLHCSRTDRPDVFEAVVGGLGLLGAIVALRMRMTRISSGLLAVRQFAAPDLDGMFRLLETNTPDSAYAVGWVDGFAAGRKLGRGLVQCATQVEDDGERVSTLRPDFQDLPDTMFGVIPRSQVWRLMRPITNDGGMHLLNALRYRTGVATSGRSTLIPHAQFQFFHDYVPNWKWAWRPGGLIQYQAFVPHAAAPAAFGALLARSRAAGLVPYLAVFKRHRPDPFLLSYGVDGYSLSLDYRVTGGNATELYDLLTRATEDVVLPVGGRFYPAKDSILTRDAMRASLGQEAVCTFLSLKRRLDPNQVLQSEFYRRAIAS